jgi:hypothetical protein
MSGLPCGCLAGHTGRADGANSEGLGSLGWGERACCIGGVRAELARGHPEVVRARPTQPGRRRARGARRPGGPASTPLTVERGLADTSGEGRQPRA